MSKGDTASKSLHRLSQVTLPEACTPGQGHYQARLCTSLAILHPQRETWFSDILTTYKNLKSSEGLTKELLLVSLEKKNDGNWLHVPEGGIN